MRGPIARLAAAGMKRVLAGGYSLASMFQKIRDDVYVEHRKQD